MDLDYTTYCIKIKINNLINCINRDNYIKIYYSLKHGNKINCNNIPYDVNELNKFNEILQQIEIENPCIKNSSYELFDYLNMNLNLYDYLIIPIISLEDENNDVNFYYEKIKKYANQLNIENYEMDKLKTNKKYGYF